MHQKDHPKSIGAKAAHQIMVKLTHACKRVVEIDTSTFQEVLGFRSQHFHDKKSQCPFRSSHSWLHISPSLIYD